MANRRPANVTGSKPSRSSRPGKSSRGDSSRRTAGGASGGGAGSGGGPARARRTPRWVVLTVLAAFALALGLVGYTGLYLVQRHHGRGVAVRVEIPESHTADAMAATLYRAGVIDRPWLFSWLLVLTGAADSAPHGTMSLRDDLTPRAVLRALASGTGVVRVTIPEGFTRFDVARRLVEHGIVASEQDFISQTADAALIARLGVRGATVEGYLFPDTYDLAPGSAAADVIDRLVRNHRRRFAELRARFPAGFERASRANLDDADIVALASLVEKETGAAEDRAHIASVFWNRLTSPEFPSRLLQSDPTILYGCRVERAPSCPDPTALARGAITRAMLDDAANRYNTYRHAGLPPGPIANPGSRALEAVLAPMDSRDLYFVAMGNGRSAFAATLADHEANVRRYLRSRGAPDSGTR